MAYIGASPTAVPLTGADIEDGTIGVADLSSTLDFSSKTITLPSGTGGKILQVVQTTKTTSFTTNSTSWTDITGYSATITPSATSSKILVLGNYSIAADTAGAGGLCYFKVLRGSTDLLESTDSGTYEHAYHEIEANTSYGHVNFGRFNLLVLDSPSTTSAITYKGQMRMNANSNTVVFGRSGRSDTNTSDARGATELILMEIGA